MYYDVVILPPNKIRKRVGKAIRKASSGHRYIYIVDNKKLIPHLSLFHVNIQKNWLAKLEKVVAKIILKHKPIYLRSAATKTNVGGGGWLTFRKPRALEKLHREMVHECKGLRNGSMPMLQGKILRPIEVLYRKQYGSHHVLRFYKPHFTLAKFLNDADKKAVQRKLGKLQCSFTADTVAICKVDKRYQVTTILKKFKLK